MSQRLFVPLPTRGVLAVSGDDRVNFLQGLVSNDVTAVTGSRAIYATLLTPQGMFLHDFFVAGLGETLLIDCEAVRRDDLKTRLLRYRLRAKVQIEDASERFKVAAVLDDGDEETLSPGAQQALGGGIVFVDPRDAALGRRLIAPADEFEKAARTLDTAPGAFEVYERWRIARAVPDGSRDIKVEKGLLLEYGIDRLNGIAWEKGCYVGQELTARTRHRANIRKRLVAVRGDGAIPAPGTPVMLDDREVGEVRSSQGDMALALIRLDALGTGRTLAAGGVRLAQLKPERT